MHSCSYSSQFYTILSLHIVSCISKEKKPAENFISKLEFGRGQDDELLQVLKVACACVLSPHKERPSMYEVYHLLRSIGERYNFSDQNDEILLVPGTTDADYSHELIVSSEP